MVRRGARYYAAVSRVRGLVLRCVRKGLEEILYGYDGGTGVALRGSGDEKDAGSKIQEIVACRCGESLRLTLPECCDIVQRIILADVFSFVT